MEAKDTGRKEIRMEAKDTKILSQLPNLFLICPYCGGTLRSREGLEIALKIQAGISFKAGIKEVVEGLWGIMHAISEGKKSEGFGIHYEISEKDWQAKLKEWGIE